MSTVQAKADAERARVMTPPGPWQWSQTWRDVLFLHWPVEPEQLRALVSPALEIDTFEGQAWSSFVGFRLRVRLRNLPLIPFVSDCVELNFRTYVRFRGEPGICFLTMDANHRLLVAAARATTPLPYWLAKIDYRGGGTACDFDCRPAGHLLPRLTASFKLGEGVGLAPENLLDAWLLERYVAFGSDGRRVYRMAVQHAPWKLREIAVRTCRPRASGCSLDGPPLAHYSDGVSALLWPIEVVGSASPVLQ